MTYVTHPNPPANDDSQKIATTAWVKDITDALKKSIDDVSAGVSGGMFPTISKPSQPNERGAIYAPSGGTWWCYALAKHRNYDNYHMFNGNYPGGATLRNGTNNDWEQFGVDDMICIKIA